MPTRPLNRRHDGVTAANEWALGSLPVGSWFDMFDVRDQLVYRGVVKDQRTTWGYTVVMPVTEGEGNFIGEAETWAIDKVRWEGNKKIVEHVSNGTLARLFDMSHDHRVQAECPVTWLGVDEEVKATIESAAAVAVKQDPARNGHGPISLLPIVSLLVIDPTEEADDDHDNDNWNGSDSGTTGESE